MDETEYLMSSKENKQRLLKSIEKLKGCEEGKADKGIPPLFLANLITWMRNKGISDLDIVDCILFSCKDN